jgi:hypothetical protein
MVLISAELATLPTVTNFTDYITLTQPGYDGDNRNECRTITEIDGTSCSSSISKNYTIRNTGCYCSSSYDSISGQKGKSSSCSSAALSSSNSSSAYGAATYLGAFNIVAKGCSNDDGTQSATINVTMADTYGNNWTDTVSFTVQ